MQRVNKIIHHPQYNYYVNEIEKFEAERIFCKHDRVHFFDVARIAQIINVEEQLGITKEVIYACGLLHDIGRYEEYLNGTDHALASVELARPLLAEVGFHSDEQEAILTAIGNHRRKIDLQKKPTDLSELLYHADKRSRLCLFCPAKELCNWPADRKNNFFYY